jgi:hypothetical protein
VALILEYDARLITGLVNDDPVSQWDDSSGSAKHIAQTTAGAKPTYKTNVLNGHPAVLFDGTADYLVLEGAGAILKNVAGATMIVLAKSVDATVTRVGFVVVTGGGLGNTRFALREGAVSGQYSLLTRRLDADAADARNGGTVSTSAFTTRSGRADYSAGTRDLRIDGSSVVSASGLGTGSTSNTDVDRIVMGQTSNLGGQFFSGHIGVVRVFDTYLSDVDVAAQEALITSEWAAAPALPFRGRLH